MLIFSFHVHLLIAFNILFPDRIEAIQDIEWIVRNHTGYTDFCYIDYNMITVDPNLKQVNGCAPMNTLMTYFYPSYVGGKVMFDALGQKQEDISVMLRYAMQYDTFYWYVDDRMSPSFKRSRFLRTEVHFGGPLPGKLENGYGSHSLHIARFQL